MAARFVPVIHSSDASRLDEADTIAVASEIAAVLTQLGYETEILHFGFDVLRGLIVREPFAVFNLVEAIAGRDQFAFIAPYVLDQLNIAYTGAASAALRATRSKLAVKRRLRGAGIPTADWWLGDEAIPADVRVIVKSDTDHASHGLDAASVVDGARAAQEIEAREARYGSSFFAEAFLDGREFNIAILERHGAPEVLPIPEIVFEGWPEDRPRIVDYDAKWNEGSIAYQRSVRKFGLDRTEPLLARRLAGIALECWRLFGLNGYARIDVRLDGAGRSNVLEINCNPCLARDAGFMATANEARLSFDEVINSILGAARSHGHIPPRAANDASGPAALKLADDQLSWREVVDEEDIARVGELVEATCFFTDAEIDIAKELVEECLKKGEAASGYSFILLERDDDLLGYACYGLTPGTEASYDLYWIVVASDLHGRGYGQRILHEVEKRIAMLGGEKIYVDTSSTEKYAPTRHFYERTGFIQVALLHDFYRSGDSKVIYEKRLSG